MNNKSGLWIGNISERGHGQSSLRRFKGLFTEEEMDPGGWWTSKSRALMAEGTALSKAPGRHGKAWHFLCLLVWGYPGLPVSRQ